MITLSTVTKTCTSHIQNIVTFSTVISYFHIVSLKSYFLMALAFATKMNYLTTRARLITIRSNEHLLNRCNTFQIVQKNIFFFVIASKSK